MVLVVVEVWVSVVSIVAGSGVLGLYGDGDFTSGISSVSKLSAPIDPSSWKSKVERNVQIGTFGIRNMYASI